jgi:hypothetical protein
LSAADHVLRPAVTMGQGLGAPRFGFQLTPVQRQLVGIVAECRQQLESKQAAGAAALQWDEIEQHADVVSHLHSGLATGLRTVLRQEEDQASSSSSSFKQAQQLRNSVIVMYRNRVQESAGMLRGTAAARSSTATVAVISEQLAQ